MNTTERLQIVESGTMSILPTGSLKFEEGVLYQEVLLFMHKPTPEKDLGMYREWVAVPEEFTNAIKAS